MRRLVPGFLAGCAFVLMSLPVVRAQQRASAPRAAYVYPAGGRQGATVEVTVGGQTLVGAREAYFTGTGIRATVRGYDRPLNPRELQTIRNKLDEARTKLAGEGTGARPRPGPGRLLRIAEIAREAGITDIELRKLVEFQQSRTNPKRAIFPQVAEKVRLEVTIDAGAATGPRELRLLTALGLSNPVRFEVGQLPERTELEPNDAAPGSVGDTLPVVLNGQIGPGDVDRYAFSARKGTHLVAAAEARALMPYLADAVPGWFQAALTLYDSRGKELAYADHFRFDPDPVLECDIPRDGDYVLEIRDAIYRGRDDFVYRITLGQIPYVTDTFPLGRRAEGTPGAALAGWNLPAKRLAGFGLVAIGPPAPRPDAAWQQLDSLPERVEKEPNDAAKQAQSVPLPVVVDGRIQRPGEADVYRFRGAAGDAVVAEIYARRLGSPLDSTLTITDSTGRQLAFNDDFDDPGAGLITHQADSRVALKLPEAGIYYVTVRDAQRHGGSEYAYRLRISAPRPDFELRVVPSSISARSGMTVPITVYAVRRDGFAGGVSLEMVDSPGFRLSGAWIPAGQDSARMTLTAAPNAAPGLTVLQMAGRATIAGSQETRPAVPADDMMQAFAYHHLVPAQEWVAVVTGRGIAPGARRREAGPIRIRAGGTAAGRFALPTRVPAAASLELSLSDPPEGISVEKVESEAGGVALIVRADAAKVRPGVRGNLIVEAYRQRIQAGTARRAAPQRYLAGVLPAIPYEIVPP